MADERRTERYLYYKNAGYKVKMYDYPKMQMAGGKRALREFDIEELLFRAPRKLTNEKTKDYYNNKSHSHYRRRRIDRFGTVQTDR